MKNRHTIFVILGLITMLSVFGYTLLEYRLPEPDVNLADTDPTEITASINKPTLQRVSQDKIKLANTQDQSTLSDFILSPNSAVLWPIVLSKDPVIVQRHNLISAWKIVLDRQLIDELEPGEQLNLYIPQTERHATITLNSIKSGRYSQSKIATIDGSDGAYSAYFTLGTETLYGSIETPEGVFHIEQNRAGDAMIYAASEIRENLDYSVSDAVLVASPVNDAQ